MSPNRNALERRLPTAAALFAALGDPTRLAIVARLSDGSSRSITELGGGAALSRQAVSKHLRVLERTRFVHVRSIGRERRYALEPDRIVQLRSHLEAISAHWDDALARLRDFVEK